MDDLLSNSSTNFSSLGANDSVLLNPNEFEFNRRLLLNVLAYSLMMVIGTIGNVLVFIAAYRQHCSPENQHGRRINVHIMVVHLTIADLIVSFIVMPLEIGWRLSVQWVAGNVACKLLMFVRAFAFYLSSMTLVCLSMDRYLAIAQPMAALKVNKNRRRGRIMILLAWLTATLFALPQTLVFRVLKHPQIEFFQCTSMNYFSEILSNKTTLSNGTVVTETTTILGLSPEILEKAYNSLFLVAVYMVPLFVIIITYANILAKIIRKRKESSSDSNPRHSQKHRLHHHTATSLSAVASSSAAASASGQSSHSSSLLCRNRSLRFARTQSVALRMSVMHVLTFVGCWTPYLVITMWHMINPTSVEKVAPEVQDALFLTAVFNSCINPLVYGGFYFKSWRASKQRMQQMQVQMQVQMRETGSFRTNRNERANHHHDSDLCLEQPADVSKGGGRRMYSSVRTMTTQSRQEESGVPRRISAKL